MEYITPLIMAHPILFWVVLSALNILAWAGIFFAFFAKVSPREVDLWCHVRKALNLIRDNADTSVQQQVSIIKILETIEEMKDEIKQLKMR